MEGKIYLVTNLVNNMKYIGATTNSMHQRKLDHLERAKRGQESVFYEDIRKFNPDNFSWEVIDTCTTKEELANKEQYYIGFFDTFKNGYNSDRGGGFKKPVFMFDLSGNLVSEFDSLVSAANAVNANKKSISNACYITTKRLGNNL